MAAVAMLSVRSWLGRHAVSETAASRYRLTLTLTLTLALASFAVTLTFASLTRCCLQIPVAAALVAGNTQVMTWSSFMPTLYTSNESRNGTTWTALLDLATGDISAVRLGLGYPTLTQP